MGGVEGQPRKNGSLPDRMQWINEYPFDYVSLLVGGLYVDVMASLTETCVYSTTLECFLIMKVSVKTDLIKQKKPPYHR